jgi:hypothetical protein
MAVFIFSGEKNTTTRRGRNWKHWMTTNCMRAACEIEIRH